MAIIHPIRAITYDAKPGVDLLPVIAPPYDVLDEEGKAELLARNDRNIVAIDLPHLPPKTVGPDAAYELAARLLQQWLREGDLIRREIPALFAYQQTYTVDRHTYRRRGLFANLKLQRFGPGVEGRGGVFPHEQTFSGPKEDRLKLMRATRAQLSPIFGLYCDPDAQVRNLLAAVIESRDCSFFGTTTHDDVLHEVWAIEGVHEIAQLQKALAPADVFIADGHHRYNTALNYRQELTAEHDAMPDAHPANYCLFVLVAMQDPGMVILPTHRVLGGMTGFSTAKLIEAAAGALKVEPFPGRDLAALEQALPGAGQHAMGLYDPSNTDAPLAVATTVQPDPLAATHADHSDAWRQLDVAVLQHLIVERILEPAFCKPPQNVTWKFPHALRAVKAETESEPGRLGVILQATPLESVRLVSQAGELMPQKSTFFYPKLATGLVMNPLEL